MQPLSIFRLGEIQALLPSPAAPFSSVPDQEELSLFSHTICRPNGLKCQQISKQALFGMPAYHTAFSNAVIVQDGCISPELFVFDAAL